MRLATIFSNLLLFLISHKNVIAILNNTKVSTFRKVFMQENHLLPVNLTADDSSTRDGIKYVLSNTHDKIISRDCCQYLVAQINLELNQSRPMIV